MEGALVELGLKVGLSISRAPEDPDESANSAHSPPSPHPHVASLSPFFTPAVLDEPVIPSLSVCSITNNYHDMIRFPFCFIKLIFVMVIHTPLVFISFHNSFAPFAVLASFKEPSGIVPEMHICIYACHDSTVICHHFL